MADKIGGKGDVLPVGGLTVDPALSETIEVGLDTAHAPNLGTFTMAVEASNDPRCTDSFGRTLVMTGIYANEGLPAQPSFTIDALPHSAQAEIQAYLREIFEPVYVTAANSVGANLEGKHIPAPSPTLLRDPTIMVVTGDLAVSPADDIEVMKRTKSNFVALAA